MFCDGKAISNYDDDMGDYYHLYYALKCNLYYISLFKKLLFYFLSPVLNHGNGDIVSVG